MEHKPTESAAAPAPLPAPVPALQLVDRAQLHASLKPTMKPATFSNWLHRSMKLYGFPEPVRMGLRSCSWSFQEVQAWLASRPRKGTFSGRRRGEQPAA